MSPRPRASWRDVRDRMFLSAAQLDELRRDAEAAGRKAWEKATKTGAAVVARTQKELQELGARKLDLQQRSAKPDGRPRSAAPGNAPRPNGSTPAVSSKPSGLQSVRGAIDAGARGAVDAATFGLGDKYEAAKFATLGLLQGNNWADSYRQTREFQEASDDYDRERHPVSRAVGGTIGTVGSIAATGGVGGAARAIPYSSRAVGTGARALMAHVGPHAAVAGAGAAAGVAGQAVSDAVGSWAGRAPDAGDYVDAALGGAVGGLATASLGPRSGATAEAYSAEASRGLRTGDFSLETAQQNAVLGAHAGRTGDLVGQRNVDRLHFKKKGDLGEFMSDVKTYVSGQAPLKLTRGERRYKTSRGHTIVDSVTDGGLLIESKFGPSARLSKNQEAAASQFDNYRVDWWDKSHVGKATGGLSGLLFGQTFEDEDR